MQSEESKPKKSRGRPKKEPSTPLARWMARTGATLEEVAAQSGASRLHINRVRLGNVKPGPMLARLLELLMRSDGAA